MPKINRQPPLWLDLGHFSQLIKPNGPHEQWQDHGLGLLRTVCHRAGVKTDVASLRAVSNWHQAEKVFNGYDVLCMNVRSYNLSQAKKAARLFKERNKDSVVIVGGMHATIAPDEMLAVEYFDVVCCGPGEEVIVDILRNPRDQPRRVAGKGVETLDHWPRLDRELWPKPAGDSLPISQTWPLEPACGWGPPPVATMLTSRVCPWRCAFCNEASYIPHAKRRSVDSVIDELNYLDQRFGVGSVVIHDSLFFQNPSWLEEWIDKYPRRARKLWPYWAAARADLVLRWPHLFEALIMETSWSTISIGFESGSERALRILNKECTVDQNLAVIDKVNTIGTTLESKGRSPPVLWANMMLAIPGESEQDAIETMAMLQCMDHVQASVSYFTPYLGTALGNQIVAEGTSMVEADPERYPVGKKTANVDYAFYERLRGGEMAAKVDRAEQKMRSRMLELRSGEVRDAAPGHLYLLVGADGTHAISYGSSVTDAIDNYRIRRGGEERQFHLLKSRKIRQQELGSYTHILN